MSNSFDLSAMDSVDTSDMEVYLNGKLTGWTITFAGPGHEKTIAQANRIAKERLRDDREKESALVNGRKWKPRDETVDEFRARNIRFVAERMTTWTPVKMDGKDFPFSTENAVALLSDPKKTQILQQALEFLGDEQSFSRRSASL